MIFIIIQGHISLDSLPRRGYHIPTKGTVQVVSVYIHDRCVIAELIQTGPKKTPFLCPDGRVATGEGRLAQ